MKKNQGNTLEFLMVGYKVSRIKRTGKYKNVITTGGENKICRQKNKKYGSYSNMKW